MLYEEVPRPIRPDEFKFNELIRKYNKKDMIKTIPYYFKCYNSRNNHIFDYIIYFYDEF